MASSDTQRIIELWLAIHGGCWPGPPPNIKLSKTVNEVLSGLALFNLSNAFAEASVAKQVTRLATESLNKSLPALQEQIKRGG